MYWRTIYVNIYQSYTQYPLHIIVIYDIIYNIVTH